jgi:hypothetical protein
VADLRAIALLLEPEETLEVSRHSGHFVTMTVRWVGLDGTRHELGHAETRGALRAARVDLLELTLPGLLVSLRRRVASRTCKALLPARARADVSERTPLVLAVSLERPPIAGGFDPTRLELWTTTMRDLFHAVVAPTRRLKAGDVGDDTCRT